MATLEAPPKITLAKVGQKRKEEKKRGAIMAWWGAPAVKSALAKVVVAMLVGAVGVGAHLAGKANRPAPGDYLANRKHKAFAPREEKRDYGAVSGLPGDQAARPDSLSMFKTGDMGGPTDAQRAADAAAAAAAANAGKDAGANGGADANKGKDAGAGGPNIDPAALMAQMGGDKGKGDGKDGKDAKNGSFDKKIGELSKFGSGSATLAGGGGMFGGSGGAFKPLSAPSNGGNARNFASGGGVPRTSGSRATGSHHSAFGQLRKAAMDGQQARAQTGEQAATTAGSVFNGAMGAGSDILGNGAGVGGSGVGAAKPAGGGNDGGGGGQGGPTSSPGSGFEDKTGNKDSNCDIMSQDTGQSLVSNGQGGCIPDANHKDVTPWKDESEKGQMWAMIAAVALAIGGLAAVWAHSGGAWGTICKWIVRVAAIAAIGAGLMAFIYGLKIFQKGGQIEGVMYMLGGLISVVMGIKMLYDNEKDTDQEAKAKQDANNAETKAQAKDDLQHNRDMSLKSSTDSAINQGGANVKTVDANTVQVTNADQSVTTRVTDPTSGDMRYTTTAAPGANGAPASDFSVHQIGANPAGGGIQDGMGGGQQITNYDTKTGQITGIEVDSKDMTQRNFYTPDSSGNGKYDVLKETYTKTDQGQFKLDDTSYEVKDGSPGLSKVQDKFANTSSADGTKPQISGRPDGNVDVFTKDQNGNMVHSVYGKDGNFISSSTGTSAPSLVQGDPNNPLTAGQSYVNDGKGNFTLAPQGTTAANANGTVQVGNQTYVSNGGGGWTKGTLPQGAGSNGNGTYTTSSYDANSGVVTNKTFNFGSNTAVGQPSTYVQSVPGGGPDSQLPSFTGYKPGGVNEDGLLTGANGGGKLNFGQTSYVDSMGARPVDNIPQWNTDHTLVWDPGGGINHDGAWITPKTGK